MTKIVEQGRKIQSIECDFTQTRTSSMLTDDAVSSGHMMFRKPDYLEWSYFTPFNYSVIVDGDVLSVEKDGKKESVDENTKKFVKELSGLIFSSVEGTFLDSKGLFRLEIYEDMMDICLKLYPQKKELKRMYTSFTIRYDKKTFNASHVEIHEHSGDLTVIEFKKCKYGFSE